MGSVAALRLTCHAIKNAVDHALGSSAQASALYAPLDQFLVDHFFPAAAATASSAGAGEAVLAPVLPLLSDSAEAARTKERFRKMADLTLGVAQARLQQSRCVCAPHCCCVASADTRLTSPVLVVCGGAVVRWCVW